MTLPFSGAEKDGCTHGAGSAEDTVRGEPWSQDCSVGRPRAIGKINLRIKLLPPKWFLDTGNG